MAEADHLVGAHVAANHAVRQPRLKGLIDDAAAGGEIGFAAREKLIEPQSFWHAAAARMQDRNKTRCALRAPSRFHLPHALTAVAAVLLEDTRAQPETFRQPGPQIVCGPIEMRVRAPAEMPGAVQDFFDPHSENDVGVRADPRASRRHIPQHRVEHLPGAAFVDRIDPNQHAVAGQKLGAHLVRIIVGVNRRLSVDPERGQFLENAAIPVVVRCRGAPGLPIAAPEDRYPIAIRGLRRAERARRRERLVC